MPTTARELSARLRPFGPVVEGAGLVLAADPPAAWEGALRVLHTGVRAVLTGRRWFGCDGRTGRVVVLDPAAPVPAPITLLCVEGDTCWDRVG